MKFLRGLSFLIGAPLYIISALNLAGYLSWTISSFIFFPAYMAGTFLLSFGLTSQHSNKHLTKKPGFWHFFCLTFFIPLYGGIGSVLVWLYRLTGPREGGSMKDAEETYSFIHFDENYLLKEFMRFGSAQKMIHHELWAQSYFDIMNGSNRGLKKALIGKILKEWTPNGIKLLQRALGDPDYDIRSYAASTLNALEDQMNKNLIEIKKKLKQSPENIPLKLKLARGYFFFVNTGIIDKVLEKHYIGIILNIIKTADESRIESQEIRLDYLVLKGDIAGILKKENEEKQVYREILEIEPGHTMALSRLCAIYFKERDFNNLKKTCGVFVSSVPANNPFIEPAKFFTPQPAGKAV